MSGVVNMSKQMTLSRMSVLIEWALFPVLMITVAMLCWWLTSSGMAIEVAVGITLITARFYVLFFEYALPRNRGVKIFRDPHLKDDLLFWLVRLLSARYMTVLTALILRRFDLIANIHIWPDGLPFMVQLLIFFAIYEFLNYWQHRLDHTIPLLWRMHSIHHSPTTMQHFKKDRHHFYYMPALYFLIILPLVVAGAPDEFFLYFAIWEGVNSTLKHSNARHRLPSWAHYFVPSADLHHIHHSRDPAQGNSNYANLPLVDVLFGTYLPPKTEIPGYGIAGDPVPQGFFRAMLFPLGKSSAHHFNNSGQKSNLEPAE